MKLGMGMAPSSLILDAVRHAAGRATRLEPVSFDGHLGAMHRPVAQAPHGVVVVLCPPLGRDARCAYRPLFLFAEALAAQGVPTLRYDHLGDGDSMPLDPEIDCWPHWTAGVEQAAAFARTHTGAQRLVLAGMRIGASLAAVAARSVKADGLVLLAPLATGQAWIRELQIAASAAGSPPPSDGSIEFGGLRLSSATVATLSDVDLRRLPSTGVETFLATPTPDPRLAASLGPRVRRAPFDGYAELFRDAHLNGPPGPVFEAAGAWLEGFAAKGPDAGPAPSPAPARLVAADWSERPVTFGADLRGVLCLPARRSGQQAVIFGNTDGDPRAGVGGFAARAGRVLASRGVAALRFDFAGLGESASPDAWRSQVYEACRTPDFAAAADLLAEEGYGDVALAGVGAGGYQALRAAIEDARFRRIMAINACLVWRSDGAPAAQPSGRARLREGPRARPSRWRRLFEADVGPRAAIADLIRRLGRRFRLRPLDAACRSVRAEIARLAVGGAQVRILVGRNAAAFEALEDDFGLQGRWLARRRGVEVSVMRDLDQRLCARRSQELALGEIFRFLDVARDIDATAAGAIRGASGFAPATNRQAAI